MRMVPEFSCWAPQHTAHPAIFGPNGDWKVGNEWKKSGSGTRQITTLFFPLCSSSQERVVLLIGKSNAVNAVGEIPFFFLLPGAKWVRFSSRRR